MTSERDQHWVLPITGMTCASCVNRLERGMKKQTAVSQVSVNLALETLDITVGDTTTPEEVRGWVTGVGFDMVEQVEVMTLENVTCASCVAKIERQLTRIPGVTSAAVNLATSQLQVKWLEGVVSVAHIRQSLSELNYPVKATVDTPDAAADRHAVNKAFIPVLIGFALSLPMVIAMVGDLLGWGWSLPVWLQFALTTPIQVWLGARFYRGAYASLSHGSANMDVLVAMGTTAAYTYSIYLWLIADVMHVYFEASAVVITLVLLGKWLENRAKAMTSEAIRSLMRLQPSQARVWRGTELETTDVDQLKIGDEIQVQPGETVAVDGIIVTGETDLDEAMLTGESTAVHKQSGDTVLAGTHNIDGSIRVRIHRSPAEFRLKQIVSMVENAQLKKAPVQYLVDKISAIFVPVVIGIAVLTFAIQWWLSGFDFALMAAISVLVIACPCALGLATPTAIIAASGVGARRGILIRDIEQLEHLAQAKTVVFDKTGTLTTGTPRVLTADYWTEDVTPLLSRIKGIQMLSQHPLAAAVVAWLPDSKAESAVTQFRNITGKGVTAKVGDSTYFMGSESLMAEHELRLPDADSYQEQDEGSVIWVAEAGRIVARLVLVDTVRSEAKSLIQWFQKKDFGVWMLSGDQQATADRIGSGLGITQVVGNLLPDHKLQAIEQLKKKHKGVIMVGDGINDAPALAGADVSIAMGTGTDVAMNTAGITLMRPSLILIAEAYQLSRKTVLKIRQNLFWAFIYNLIGIPLAAMGLLSPIIAGAAMAFSSVSVVASSLLLLRWKPNTRAIRGSIDEN
jgi:Cu+-exporting ATPase